VRQLQIPGVVLTTTAQSDNMVHAEREVARRIRVDQTTTHTAAITVSFKQ
jgi:hypothetical protein